MLIVFESHFRNFIFAFMHQLFVSVAVEVLVALHLCKSHNGSLGGFAFVLQLQNIFSYKPVLAFGTEQMAIFNSRESKF